MKGYILIILITLLFLPSISHGQAIDVETERFPGTKILIIKSVNGPHEKKGYKTIYYFDNNGRAVKSSTYFKRKLLSFKEYYYNDIGFLINRIQTFFVMDEIRRDTTMFEYTIDTNGKVTSKTEKYEMYSETEYFVDLDTLKNTQPFLDTLKNNIFIIKRKFDTLGNVVLNQRLSNDTIIWTEESKYNKFGDKVYSNIPTLLDKETGKMVFFIVGSRYTGCRRYAIIEVYEYTYDKLNRWTEKYVVFDNRKILLEKRVYK